jgi:hypothetical protein
MKKKFYCQLALWQQGTELDRKVEYLIFQPQKKQNDLSSMRHSLSMQPYYLMASNRESTFFDKVIRSLRDGEQSKATEVVFSNLRLRNKVLCTYERYNSTDVFQKL